MGSGKRWDLARQTANVFGALFQVGVTFAASATIQEVVDSGPHSLVEPALYAFAIWALIFVLSLAYAAYQALPSNRENPLLRRIGWFTAGAFFCTGLWSIFVPERQLVLAQAMLLVVFVCLAVSFLQLAHAERGVLNTADRWLVALPLGPFLGWITAANAVSLTSEALRLGLVTEGGYGEALLGSTLLLLGGVLAAALVLSGKAGPVQGYLSYAATVLWALVAVVVNQYDASLLTTGAALVAVLPIVLALIGQLPGGWARQRNDSAAKPDVTA
jgi:benzodiazapine receptor